MNTLQSSYVASAVLLTLLAIARPHWLLRPSFVFACMMTVVINFSAAFASKPHWPDSSLVDSLRMSAIVFPLAILAWIACTPFLSQVGKKLLANCRNPELVTEATQRNDRIVAWLFLAVCVLIACWYFTSVRLQSTGLWAILFDHEASNQAREDSLKLVDSSLLKYVYSICTKVIAPVTVALLLFQMAYRRMFSSTGMLIAIIGLLVLIGITGARMPLGRVVLVIGIAIALSARTRTQLLVLPAAAIGTLALIAMITLLRAGKGMLDESAALAEGIANRAFIIPFETGVFSVAYASERGFLDGANVRPFAILSEQSYIPLSSNVYHAFYFVPGASAIESGSANTCFLFDFQAGFGIWTGWWIALVAIGLLDFGLLAFRSLKGALLPTLMAPFLITAGMDLTSSAYTTQLLTGGIGLIIVLAIAVPILLKQKTIDIART